MADSQILKLMRMTSVSDEFSLSDTSTLIIINKDNKQLHNKHIHVALRQTNMIIDS